MNCSKCGAQIKDGLKFCPSCGTPTQAGVQQTVSQPGGPNQGTAIDSLKNIAGNVRVTASPEVRVLGVPVGKGAAGDRGLVIAVAVLFIAAIASVAFYITGRNAARSAEDASPEAGVTETGAVSAGQESGGVVLPGQLPGQTGGGQTVKLPAGAELLTGATQNDVVGDWEGEFTFTAMDGFGDIPGAPDNIEEIVAEAMSAPVPFRFTFDEDRSWEFRIDFMGGMWFDSNDMRDREAVTPEAQNAHLYQGPEDGMVLIHPTDVRDTESDGSGSMTLNGAVCRDGEGKLMVGDLNITMDAGGVSVTLAGTYSVRPED